MIPAFVVLLAATTGPPDVSRAGLAKRPTSNAPAPSGDRVASAPTEPSRVRSSIFLEAFGTGGLYSLNYEARLGSGLGARVGASYVRVGTSGGSSAAGNLEVVTVPAMASITFGRREHNIELGVGATALWFSGRARIVFATVERSELLFLATGFVGYRYIPRDGGIMAHVGFTPLVMFGDGMKVLPWGALAAGWSF
jgi:hypothetical protein